ASWAPGSTCSRTPRPATSRSAPPPPRSRSNASPRPTASAASIPDRDPFHRPTHTKRTRSMTDTLQHTTESTLLDGVADGLFIGGEWVPAEGGKTLAVADPSTGKTIKEIADASVADGLRALEAAVAAQDAGAATAPRERGELLRRAFDLLQQRKEDFALLMTLEMGKPL